MKFKHLLTSLAAGLLSASMAHATTLADWTFESSGLGSTTPSEIPGANTPTTNYYAEAGAQAGTAIAIGLHAASATYTSSAGNGSSKSLSSTQWGVGDYYQFQLNSVGAHSLVVTWDTVSSGTGPGNFLFEYSTDGTTFTTFAPYTTLSNAWSSGTPSPASSHTNDLSSITALNNASVVYFRLVDNSTTSASGGTVGTAGTSRVDNFAVNAATGMPPVFNSVSPSSQTVNAGTSATITALMASGDTPFTYMWYKGSATPGNLIETVTNGTPTNILTLSNLTLADAGSYLVVVTNGTGMSVTSSVVTLSVNDPAINTQPASQSALVGGAAEFNVFAGGTGLSYQWYYTDSGGTPVAPVSNGTTGTGSVASGATSSSLTISGLTASDPTNFVVVVSGTAPGNDGPITSSVAALTVGTTGGILAYWDFNDPYIDPANPAPGLGIGSATTMNVTPFMQPVGSTSVDGNDYATPNASWGTEAYPVATALNKQAGVQFNAPTTHAKNIKLSFDIRGTSTASKYQRVQFTTDGSTWIDYPASQSIASGFVSAYVSFAYDLSGIPGVANNPNFGVRIVTEFENTARYNDTNDATYVAIVPTSTYGPGGTVSYDLVTINADAITDANNPPTVPVIPDQKMPDLTTAHVNFTVSDDSTPAGSLTVSATSLDPSVNLSVSGVNTGGNVQLTLVGNNGGVTTNYVPILVKIGDGEDVTTRWFIMELDPANSPPNIAGLVSTNMPPNTNLVMPFQLTDDHTDPSTITPTVTSGNSTLVPNDGAHLALSGSSSNRVLTITPAANQLGAVPISVSATDGDGKNTTLTFVLEVRPNTNVVLIDYFGYDSGSPSIVTNSGGLWQTHSGVPGQLKAGGGVATNDGVHNTEDVNAQFLDAPYGTNTSAVLYSSFVINFTTSPGAGGAYFSHFKDNTTFGFIGRVWAFTNGVTPGYYHVGIANSANGGLYTGAASLPQDLALNANYTVVTRLSVSNAISTIWVNPLTESSPHATDLTDIGTNKVDIYSYAFRESTSVEGIVNISKLRVGTTFDSVLPVLQVSNAAPNVTLTWTDPTLGVQYAPSVTGPWTDITGAKSPFTTNTSPVAEFFKFGQ